MRLFEFLSDRGHRSRRQSLPADNFELPSTMASASPFPVRDLDRAAKVGFRFGAKGTHTSRTMMFDELAAVLAAAPEDGIARGLRGGDRRGQLPRQGDHRDRRLSNQRPRRALRLGPTEFRSFGCFGDFGPSTHLAATLLALQCALARDPLLAATVSPVLALAAGSDVQRDAIRAA